MEKWKGVVTQVEKRQSKKGNDYFIYRVSVDGKNREFSSFKVLPFKKGGAFEVSVELSQKMNVWQAVEPPKSVGKPSSAGEIGVSSEVENQDLAEVGRFFSILEAVFDEAVGLAGVTSEDCCDIASTIYINAKQKERFQR